MMKVLVPIEVTSFTTNVAEPHASETVWVSAGSYAKDVIRVVAAQHKQYIALQTHTGRTVSPELDTDYWEEYGPTVKYAPFDTYVSTPAIGTTSLYYTVPIGFFDSMSIYGLVGTQLTVVHKDGPGGSTLETRNINLYAESLGLFEYLFGPKNQKSKVILKDFALRPLSEITATVSAPASAPVKLGMLNMGFFKNFIQTRGGTQQGASVEPTTTSRVITDSKTGRVTIKKGNSATGLRASLVMLLEDANYALQLSQEVLDVPASFVEDQEKYEGLNVFGLGSMVLTYDTQETTRLSLNVKGMI